MGEEKKPIFPLLVWCDLETTGISESDTILEIALILTDNELNELAWFESLVANCEPKNLIRSDRPRTKDTDIPCWGQHFENGLVTELIAARRDSQRWLGIDADVQRRAIEWLEHHEMRGVPLCGSSVHFDRAFLKRYMPDLHSMFHYRNIDVSGIRELQRRWMPDLEIPEPNAEHRALPDLRDTINLLRHFRNSGFIGGQS